MNIKKQNYKIIFLNVPENLLIFLNYKFLLLGQPIYNYQNINIAKTFIKQNKKDIFFIFIYIESINDHSLKLIIAIKKNYSILNCHFVVISSKINAVFMQSMLLLEVKKVFFLPQCKKNQIFKDFIFFIQKFISLKQESVKTISPNDNDSIQLYLTIPNTRKMILTKILDISIREIHLEIEKYQDLKSLIKYTHIPNVKFILDSQIAITDIKIQPITEISPIILCEFINSSERFINLLTEYIMNKNNLNPNELINNDFI